MRPLKRSCPVSFVAAIAVASARFTVASRAAIARRAVGLQSVSKALNRSPGGGSSSTKRRSGRIAEDQGIVVRLASRGSRLHEFASVADRASCTCRDSCACSIGSPCDAACDAVLAARFNRYSLSMAVMVLRIVTAGSVTTSCAEVTRSTENDYVRATRGRDAWRISPSALASTADATCSAHLRCRPRMLRWQHSRPATS